MSKLIRKIIFSNICIDFTWSILIISIGHIVIRTKEHILHGGGIVVNGFCLFACELLLLLCLLTAACTALEKLHFKNKRIYIVLELLINYFGSLGGAYVFHWMKFSSKTIKEIAIITIPYLYVYFWIRKRRQKEAEEINRLLKKREA